MNIKKNELMELAYLYENLFRYKKYKGNEHNANKETIILGDIPILVSCPHTVFLTRDGYTKPPELFLGAIGYIIQGLTGCHFIYANQNDLEDPNMINETNYKKRLRKFIENHNIKYFLDLHGASLKREFDVDLGTDYQKTIGKEEVDEIKGIFNQNKISDVRENDTFKADKPSIYTYFCYHELNVSALQMEFNASLRNPRENVDGFYHLIKSLKEIVLYLNKNSVD